MAAQTMPSQHGQDDRLYVGYVTPKTWLPQTENIREHNSEDISNEHGIKIKDGARREEQKEPYSRTSLKTDIQSPDQADSPGKEDDLNRTALNPDQVEPTDHRHSQLATTLTWLTDNYERSEGVCLPRCVLYTHYLDFCKKNTFSPAGAATFGKIIRQRFPKLTTRRLGTRGQSKYHYYGIGIKETSIYYHSVYTGKGLTRFSGTKVKTEGSNRKYSLSSKTGTLLPEFPNPDNLILPTGVDPDKVNTFHIMYKTHCQRILDTVIGANFEEVQSFLLHFWQGMPDHLLPLLTCDVIVDMVVYCDWMLYKALVDVLIPTTIQDLPDSLGCEIRLFARKLMCWLQSSLEGIPQKMQQRKIQAAKPFVQTIQRHISFVHLAQTSRGVLTSQETVTQMSADLQSLDLTRICQQAAFADPTITSRTLKTMIAYFEDVHTLLAKQASIECYTELLDNIVDSCVLQICKRQGAKFEEQAATFLLQWTAVGSLLMKDLTLCSAMSFGSLHLLHMMLDEYVLLVMETQQLSAREKEVEKTMQKNLRNTDSDSESSIEQALPRIKDHKLDSLSMTYPTSPVNKRMYQCPWDAPESRLKSYVPSSFQDVHPNMLPSVKHLPPIPVGHFDRTTCLPHHSDFGGNVLQSAKIQGCTEAHVQSSPGPPYTGIVQTSATYWNDPGQRLAQSDTYYGSHCAMYNKYCSYDTCSVRSSPYNRGIYPEPLQRSAFEPTRNFYTRSYNSLTGHERAAGPYVNGYTDFMATPAQYCRQDSTLIPCPNNFYSSALHSNIQPHSTISLVPPFR